MISYSLPQACRSGDGGWGVGVWGVLADTILMPLTRLTKSTMARLMFHPSHLDAFPIGLLLECPSTVRQPIVHGGRKTIYVTPLSWTIIFLNEILKLMSWQMLSGGRWRQKGQLMLLGTGRSKGRHCFRNSKVLNLAGQRTYVPNQTDTLKEKLSNIFYSFLLPM